MDCKVARFCIRHRSSAHKLSTYKSVVDILDKGAFTVTVHACVSYISIPDINVLLDCFRDLDKPFFATLSDASKNTACFISDQKIIFLIL